MWIYVFGSTVRGEIDKSSDVDVLAVVENKKSDGSFPENFLIYEKSELVRCFEKGELFAHHLFSESRLIYSSDSCDIIKLLGKPSLYLTAADDVKVFYQIAIESINNLRRCSNTIVFECGLIYMALRDIAMIVSYIESGEACFSKYSPYNLSKNLELDISKYKYLKSCRAISTRGLGESKECPLNDFDLNLIDKWLHDIRGGL